MVRRYWCFGRVVLKGVRSVPNLAFMMVQLKMAKHGWPGPRFFQWAFGEDWSQTPGGLIRL